MVFLSDDGMTFFAADCCGRENLRAAILLRVCESSWAIGRPAGRVLSTTCEVGRFGMHISDKRYRKGRASHISLI